MQLSPDQIFDTVKLLYGALTAIIFIFGAELLTRFMHSDPRTRTDAAHLVFLTIACSVIGYGCYMIVAIVNYGLVTGIEKSEGRVALQFLLVLIILVPMALISERIVFRKNNAVISTVIGMLITNYTIILTILAFVDGTLDTWFLFIPVVIAIIILGAIGLSGFIMIFFGRLGPQKDIARKIAAGFLIGLVGLAGSFWAVTGRGHNTMPYVYGTIIEILGWLGLRYFMLSIPSYSEFEWRTGMNELYIIMYQSGITLYFHPFRPLPPAPPPPPPKPVRIGEGDDDNEDGDCGGGGRPDAELIGSGMIGISAMIAEIAKTDKNLESINMGDKYFNFKHGKVILALLLTDQKLGVYYSLLTRLVEDLEQAHPELEDFNGDVSRYRESISNKIKEIFGSESPKEVARK
jgi:hypothetical protein